MTTSAPDSTLVDALDPVFLQIFRSSPQPKTLSTRAEGRILAVNGAYEQLSGRSASELVGQTAESMGVLSLEQRTEELTRWEESGTNVRRDFRLRRPDGRDLHCLVFCVGFDLQGVSLLYTTFSDVSDRYQAEEELRESERRISEVAAQLAALLDAIPAAVWVTRDSDCALVTGNQVAYEMLRVAAGKNLSKTAPDTSAVSHFDVFHEGRPLKSEELPLQRSARSGQALRDFQEEVRFSDGSALHLYGNVVPIRGSDGRVQGAVSAFIDVTRLVAVERELRERADVEKQLLGVVSHDLRNPLTAARLAADTIGRLPDVADKVRRSLKVIQKSTDRALRLISDLLDFAEARSGIALPITRESLDMHSVAAAVLEEMRAAHPNRQLVHEAVGDAQGEWDGGRLHQVMVNLLGNALQYSRADSVVTVKTMGLAEAVRLEVCNAGTPIPDDLIPRLFEPFRRGTRSQRASTRNLGLGLFIVQHLVQAHGGSVSVVSDREGTTFTVHLPKRLPAA